MKQQDFYAYWFNNIIGIGAAKQTKLLEYFQDAGNIYHATERELMQCMAASGSRLFQKEDLNSVLQSRDERKLTKQWEQWEQMGMRFTYPGHNKYPERLALLPDAPRILYYRGALPCDAVPSAAVIGARGCSAYGRQIASALGKFLAKSGIQVISGLAYGIDTYGHNGALDGIQIYRNQTCSQEYRAAFAVLACGADICYPAGNIELYMRLLEMGGVLSEYAPGTRARQGFFPIRNRIISGLADVVIVVEAKKRSGSLITVNYALEQGREVMAVPGRIGDILSEGCNDLIRQGAHMLIESRDVLDIMGIDSISIQKKQKFTLASEEEKVYGSICFQPKSINQIIEETGFNPSKVSEILLNLELSNLAAEVSKNCYVRCEEDFR